MNIYLLTLVKSLFTLLIQSYTYYNTKDISNIDKVLFVIPFIYNLVVIFYIKYKSDLYRSRFLRKNYKPSLLFLITCLVLENVLLIIFYFKFNYLKIGIFNLVLVVILSIPNMLSTTGRKTVPLVSNEEFFKIAFLIDNFIEKEKVLIKKGEVVQILDNKGEILLVRNSEGQTFNISSRLVNDDIDLVI